MLDEDDLSYEHETHWYGFNEKWVKVKAQDHLEMQKKLVLFVTSLVYGIPVRRDIRKCRQPKGLLHSNSRLRTLTLHRITVTRIENAVTSTAAKSRLTDTQNLRQRNSR